ncbi:hypothetical protein WA026_009282 [Henosepilachna vigintioctopunctata]|uniref:DNA/RNA non-specific endonuclease/pyrophosphatase/phosphodiesterase domain-containing protein n=1 Tax=Henosepilachna vigintioctopunctata TaxID=420089 RepID=A0AAW1UZR2_9CUCU
MRVVGIFTVLLCSVIQVYSQGCSLPVAPSDEQHLPILVDNSGSVPKLALPHHGNIELNKGDKILLSCPNPRNTLTLTKTDSAEAECVGGETLKILDENQDYQSVLCAKGLRGSALPTDDECAEGQGYIIKIGFPQADDQFLTLIEVCYDAANGNALYTTHTLYGSEMEYRSKESYRPGFSTAGLAPGVAANVAYKQATQKTVLNKLLGSAKLAEQYINRKSFLARGHLSPDADFLFASWQFATFFYVNTVPQWQAVNNGNWKRLESLAKDSAAAYDEDLQVYTGAHGVLSLPDVNGVDTEIHLSNDKLAVPKFMWKILQSKSSGKAIAFVSLNNPFLTELDTSDKICTDICSDYGWDEEAWSNGAKGFIYCCDVDELLEAVPAGPKLNVKGILAAPGSSCGLGRFGFRRQGC